jgi:vitamin B12/bleomycin/antimicrobial peptide transport system ATP-binding/permease protein
MRQVDDQHTTQYLLARYWEAALGFWRRDARQTAWLLTIAVFSIALLNLGLGLLLNIWNRVMFDGIDNRDMRIVLFQSVVFLPLVLASLAMAVADTYSKMSLQRRWRAWLNGHVLDRWLTSGRYYQLTLRAGEHTTPESRVAEDLRLSVDAPVDIVLGVFAAVISLITYIGVLWYIGGEITIPIGNMMLRIPGFLVITAFLYAVLASGAMVTIARGFVPLAENRSQAEADYRYALTRVRENAESIALLGGDAEERAGLDSAYRIVRKRWRAVMMQSIRTTIVGNTTNGLAPIIPLLLCAPKYVAGTMTLGQMMQAASAFITVQHSFNWLVENYPRVADWTAAARRLASLLVSLDGLNGADGEAPDEQIVRIPAEEGALRLRDLSLTSDVGSAIVNDADIEIAPGERVLVVGESGTGKSTLVRAIAGLWPWGVGEVRLQHDGLFVMPQRPYVPLGTLRRAVTYPLSPETVDGEVVRQSIEDVGLAHFLDRLDADEHWDQVLSGGEKQRLGFARMLIQNPKMIVMDEATAALDPSSQDGLMRLVLERLPAATLVSVAHRVELEAFHTRKLVLEYGDEGSRLVGDEALHPAIGASAARSHDHVRLVRRPRPARESVSARLTPSRAHAVVKEVPEYSTAPALAPAAPALAPSA